MGFLVSGRSSR